MTRNLVQHSRKNRSDSSSDGDEGENKGVGETAMRKKKKTKRSGNDDNAGGDNGRDADGSVGGTMQGGREGDGGERQQQWH